MHPQSKHHPVTGRAHVGDGGASSFDVMQSKRTWPTRRQQPQSSQWPTASQLKQSSAIRPSLCSVVGITDTKCSPQARRAIGGWIEGKSRKKWWRTQSHANPSLLTNSLLTGKTTGNFDAFARGDEIRREQTSKFRGLRRFSLNDEAGNYCHLAAKSKSETGNELRQVWEFQSSSF